MNVYGMNVYSKICAKIVGGAVKPWSMQNNIVPGDIVIPYPQVLRTIDENAYCNAKEGEVFLVIAIVKHDPVSPVRDVLEHDMIIMASDCSLWEIRRYSKSEASNVG